MDNQNAAWKKFSHSGRAADYLAYRASLRSETAAALEPELPPESTEDSRPPQKPIMDG